MSEMTGTELLEACIEKVWNQHEEALRMKAMKDIYHPDAVIFEPDRSVTGHEAISKIVGEVLADMPKGFRFAVTGPVSGHHGIATARWKGVSEGNTIVSGSDVAKTAKGLIIEHYFFFDPKD